MDPWLRNFLFGMLGSTAVELVAVFNAFEAGKPLSVRYTRPAYLICRVLLVPVAGLIAAAAQPPGDLWAIGTGAAAPAFLDNLRRRSGG
jgi:hypothetical protein